MMAVIFKELYPNCQFDRELLQSQLGSLMQISKLLGAFVLSSAAQG